MRTDRAPDTRRDPYASRTSPNRSPGLASCSSRAGGRGVRHRQGDRARRVRLGAARARPAGRWATSRWDGSSAPDGQRLRAGRPGGRAWSGGPDPVPCGACAARRVGHVPQRPLHRARHQGARRLRQRAVDGRARATPSSSTRASGIVGVLTGADQRGRQGVGAGRADRRAGLVRAAARCWSPAPGRSGCWPRCSACSAGSRCTCSTGSPTGPKPDLVARPRRHLPPRRRRRASAAAQPDVVIEATGVGQLVFDAMAEHRRRYGIVCLTGVSSGGPPCRSTPADSTASMVLENDVVVGSVNANLRHYRPAADALAAGGPGLAAPADHDRRVPLDEAADGVRPPRATTSRWSSPSTTACSACDRRLRWARPGAPGQRRRAAARQTLPDQPRRARRHRSAPRGRHPPASGRIMTEPAGGARTGGKPPRSKRRQWLGSSPEGLPLGPSGLGLVGNALFVVGSVMFFWDSVRRWRSGCSCSAASAC